MLAKKDTPIFSIKRRLFRYLAIGLPLLWLVTMSLSVSFVFHEMNEGDDAEMREIASLMATLSVAIDTSQAGQTPDNHLLKALESDDADNGFAIWTLAGRRLSADELGETIPFNSNHQGFADTQSWWKSSAVRVLYLQTTDGKVIAIGQRWAERIESAVGVAVSMLIVLLLGIPLFILFTNWAINRCFSALTQLATDVDNRSPNDLTPLNQAIPKELQPFIAALNRLFVRVAQTFEQEQRFTSDAAHELRSPLAAIKAQSDALRLSPNRDKQLHHAEQIGTAANRATHLVDQLLTLSRLDPMTVAEKGQTVDWQAISEQALQNVHHLAREKCSSLKRNIIADSPEQILPLRGDIVLLVLLLRNLLDNAIRYSIDEKGESHEKNVVELTLANDYICVRDHGKGIADEYLNRVHERFFRPAGQNETGSGLGLSIVERIAKLHGLTFSLDNHVEGGVVACLVYEQTKTK